MNTIHKFVLVYPENMPENGKFGTNKPHYEKHYSGAYVGLDVASGGYPYPEKNIQRAKWFDTVEEVDEYLSHFSDYGYRVGFITIHVSG